MSERDLTMGLRLYAESVNAAALRGAGKAGLRFLRDVEMDIPTAPLKEGTLRGSGTLHVQSKCVEVADNVGGEPTPNTDPVEQPPPGVVEAVVGFNVPYAAVQHEGEWASGPLAGVTIKNYSEPSSGPKFIERKLAANSNDYMEIWAGEIRKGTGGRGGIV